MAAPEGYALARINERMERLNEVVRDLREADARKAAPVGPNAELMTAIRAINLTSQVQTANIKALLDMVGMLAEQIDGLRTHRAS